MKSYILTEYERKIINDYLADVELSKAQHTQLVGLVHRGRAYKKRHTGDAKLITALLTKYKPAPRGRPKGRKKKGSEQ